MRKKLVKRCLAALLTLAVFITQIPAMESVYGAQSSQSQEPLVVVLDPGHDSTHAGAGYSGYKEESLCLTIAQYCKDYLEQYDNVVVYMTRDTEKCAYSSDHVSTVGCNDRRVEYAKSVGADVFISFHLNAATSTSAKGAAVYYPNENYRPEFNTKGKALATNILKKLNGLGISTWSKGILIRNSENGTTYPDGTLADYLGVIRKAKLAEIPAVLIEHAFLSNSSDRSNFLNTDAKLKKIGYADAKAIAETYGLTLKTGGLAKASDGNWYYYVDGKVNTSFTGTVQQNDYWYYVKNGKVDFSYTGLAKTQLGWWYFNKGVAQLNYTGLVKNSNGYWGVFAGRVDFSYTGLLKYGGAWWYLSGGKLNTTYTGLAKNDYGWWYVKNGMIDFTYNGMAKNKHGWWYVKNGTVDFTYTGLAKNDYGWWYMKKGGVDFSYTGLAKYNGSWWYMKNGKLQDTCTGLIKHDSKWYYVENGRWNKSYTGIAQNSFGWWYVTNGMLDLTYTGLAQNEYGWWYLTKGAVDYGYTNLVKYKGCWWYVEKGKLLSNYTGMIAYNSTLYYVKNGRWINDYTGISSDRDGNIWYVKNGKKDTTYTGFAESELGRYKFKGGVVDTSYNGLKQEGNQWRYYEKGKWAVDYTGLANNDYGWFYVQDGVINWNYTGLCQYGKSWYYVKAGVLDRSYTGMAANNYGNWYVVNGKVSMGTTALVNVDYKWSYIKAGALQTGYTGLVAKDGIYYYVEKGYVNFKYTGLVAQDSTLKYVKSGIFDTTYTGFADYNGKTWYVQKGVVDYSYTGDAVSDGESYMVVDGEVTDQGTEIMGTTTTTVEKMVKYYCQNATYPTYYANTDAPTIEDFCQIYLEECEIEGVKAEVAFCQAMLETGFLRYGGQVDISQFNFAGLGATDGGAAGASFADVRTGVRAQVQHLKAYACNEALAQTCVDPRFSLVKRGTAPFVEWLGIQENPNTVWATQEDGTQVISIGRGWASSKNYGYTIKSKYMYKLNNI